MLSTNGSAIIRAPVNSTELHKIAATNRTCMCCLKAMIQLSTCLWVQNSNGVPANFENSNKVNKQYCYCYSSYCLGRECSRWGRQCIRKVANHLWGIKFNHSGHCTLWSAGVIDNFLDSWGGVGKNCALCDKLMKFGMVRDIWA